MKKFEFINLKTIFMNQELAQKLDNLTKLIGNTNLIKINFNYKGEPKTIFAKAEHTNFSGSIKDRIALHIMRKAYENGLIQPDTQVVEATSGNTGIAFTAVSRNLGHSVVIYMPDWMSIERINLMRSFGANIRLVSHEEGGFLGSIAMTKEHAEKYPNVFLPCQFENNDNVEAHYLTTGPEIWAQMESAGAKIDAFVAGVGTGGTVMGVGKFLREKDPTIKVHPLEPSNSPVLQTGTKVGSHRIQGISDEFIPSIVKLKELDSIVSVDDGDSIIMAQKIAKELGFAVGISSGANFIGALQVLLENPQYKNVVTIFSDNNRKYLSTDYSRNEPVREGYLSPDVELLGIEVFPIK